VNYRLSVFILLMIFSYPALVSAADPYLGLPKRDAETSIILNKKSISDKDMEKLKTVLCGFYNFEKIAENSLPKKTWDAMDTVSRKNYTRELQRLIVNTTVKKYLSGIFTDFNTHKFTYEIPVFKKNGTESFINKHWIIVSTEKVLVDVTIKMDLINNNWLAYDVIEDGQSMTLNYKNQFQAILATKKVPELIETIKKRADEIVLKK